MEKRKLIQYGGVIPENITSLLAKNDDGSFDVTDSIDAFIGRWKGPSVFNDKRSDFLHRCFDPFVTVNPGVSLNIYNARGNGSCFYECIFMWAKMALGGFPFDTYEALKTAVFESIEEDDEFKAIYGESLSFLIADIKEPNCPQIELPLKKISKLFSINVRVVSISKNRDILIGSVNKYVGYGDSGDKDCITIIVSEGHVYLVFPRVESGSSAGSSVGLRRELYNRIPDIQVTL